MCSMSNDKQVCRPPSKPILKKALQINGLWLAKHGKQVQLRALFSETPYLSNIYAKHRSRHKKAPHLRGFF
ncbi:hypothetical protein VCHC60A1_3645 [Vibrio cholerae HC-60A1]|nr:hypothetical protein VCHC60A1_3645 [Vibrio cholerae HC-60A1]